MSEFLLRSCPLCGASQLTASHVDSRPSALDLSFEQLRSHWHGFFAQHIFFPYARCAVCGQLYCQTYFEPEQLEKLYGDMPDNTAGLDVTALRRTQGRYAATLRRHAPVTGDYLEVGPDIGLFTEAAVADRDYTNLYLFEPNRSIWPALEQRLGASRCRLSDVMDDYGTVPDASIGAAAMIHVLDHALEPIALLRAMATKLAPGGALAIVTHDESSLLARLLGARWLPYCLQHPQLYRPATIVSALTAAGLEVVEVSKTSNDFPLTYLLRHGLSAVGLPHAWIPEAQRPALALKLGNLITVARRPEQTAPMVD